MSIVLSEGSIQLEEESAKISSCINITNKKLSAIFKIDAKKISKAAKKL